MLFRKLSVEEATIQTVVALEKKGLEILNEHTDRIAGDVLLSMGRVKFIIRGIFSRTRYSDVDVAKTATSIFKKTIVGGEYVMVDEPYKLDLALVATLRVSRALRMPFIG